MTSIKNFRVWSESVQRVGRDQMIVVNRLNGLNALNDRNYFDGAPAIERLERLERSAALEQFEKVQGRLTRFDKYL